VFSGEAASQSEAQRVAFFAALSALFGVTQQQTLTVLCPLHITQ
jgi:hypothetical protein